MTAETFPKNLKDLMLKHGLREEDMEEQFIRSSGAGGQNVNKVATCVVLSHHPSGIRVKCQTERSQQLNRLKARRLLVQKLVAQEKEKRFKEQQKREKMLRQKRKRPAHLKEAILEGKRQRKEKKEGRRKLAVDVYD